MRAVPAAPGSTTAQVSAEQLVAMAVVAAEIAAATPRLEVYPRGLDAGRAVRLASGALSGVAQLTPAQVAERVAARFPEAAALDAISAAGPVVLLLNAGILARYDPSLSLLDSLREQVTHAGADAPVRTVWLLVPWHDAEAVPRLDDAAVPIFGPQWLALREDWLIRREGRVADGVA